MKSKFQNLILIFSSFFCSGFAAYAAGMERGAVLGGLAAIALGAKGDDIARAAATGAILGAVVCQDNPKPSLCERNSELRHGQSHGMIISCPAGGVLVNTPNGLMCRREVRVIPIAPNTRTPINHGGICRSGTGYIQC